MRIAYISQDQYNLVKDQHNTEYSLFCPFQDDVSMEYYLVEDDVVNTNAFEFLWVKHLPLVDLPAHEHYKFKQYSSQG